MITTTSIKNTVAFGEMNDIKSTAKILTLVFSQQLNDILNKVMFVKWSCGLIFCFLRYDDFGNLKMVNVLNN